VVASAIFFSAPTIALYPTALNLGFASDKLLKSGLNCCRYGRRLSFFSHSISFQAACQRLAAAIIVDMQRPRAKYRTRANSADQWQTLQRRIRTLLVAGSNPAAMVLGL